MKIPIFEKKAFFGHTSFIKVVINGTIATECNSIPHEGFSQAGQYLSFLSFYYGFFRMFEFAHTRGSYLVCFLDTFISLILIKKNVYVPNTTFFWHHQDWIDNQCYTKIFEAHNFTLWTTTSLKKKMIPKDKIFSSSQA